MEMRILGKVGILLIVITLWVSLAYAAPAPTSALAQTQTRVVIFWHKNTGWDFITIMPLCAELGFSFTRENYTFINNDANFFDEKGKRKFAILFFAGGESIWYFAKNTMPGIKSSGTGIDEKGCQNIRNFIRKGGACIATCFSGCTIFAETSEWIGLNLVEAMAGKKWEPFVRKWPGHMVRLYGGNPIFKGTVRGPQESNQPYPRTRFLPITLNTENSIIKKTNLPNTVYLCTIGSGSLIPNPDQAMEVIGWFPNGTAAMGIVKYGDGHLYMIAPHPSMTLENSGDIIREGTMGTHARRWGWSEKQIKEAQLALDKEGDPDGPDHDLLLMKAILKDAADRSSAPAR